MLKLLGECFRNMHPDTNESGREEVLSVDQSQGSFWPQYWVQLAFSFYTPKPKGGVGGKQGFKPTW